MAKNQPITWESIGKDMLDFQRQQEEKARAIAELEQLATQAPSIPSKEVLRLLAIVKSDGSQVA